MALNGAKLTGSASFKYQASLRWYDSDESHYAGLKSAATVTSSVDYTLPTAPPASNDYVLSCTTAGVMSWAVNVSSVFGRTGAVVAASGDYTATLITTGTFPSGVTWNGVIVGGTGNGFTKFTGPATSERTFTLPNASATILTTDAVVTAAQGGSGNTTYTDGQLLIGQTSGSLLSVAALTAGVGIGITNGAGSITVAVNQSTGWTTPTCTPERTTLLCAASATADNCSKWITAIITDLKAAGIFAA